MAAASERYLRYELAVVGESTDSVHAVFPHRHGVRGRRQLMLQRSTAAYVRPGCTGRVPASALIALRLARSGLSSGARAVAARPSDDLTGAVRLPSAACFTAHGLRPPDRSAWVIRVAPWSNQDEDRRGR
jgi:hypothetical protein